jgi:outer membrane lipoprotein-sorting protein
MARAESGTSYSGTLVQTAQGKPTETMRLWHSGRRWRREWAAPAVRRGDVQVDDGINVWVYHRQENAAVQTRSASPTLSKRLSGLGVSFEAKVTGSETIGGRKAWKLEIRAPHSAVVTRRLWIDSNSHLILRRQRLLANGQVGAGNELRNLRIGAIPASLFVWKAPAGVSLTRTTGRLFRRLHSAQREAGWLRVPNHLPAGYAFESAIVDSAHGEAWLRYSTGAHRFSIFEQRVTDKRITAPTPVAGGGLYWLRDGSRFLAVGLTTAQARAVAAAMR